MILDLWTQIVGSGLPEPQTEHRFHAKRRWRFDLAYPEILLAIEREGGTWTRGRHTRGKGYENDCRKYSEAALMGWTVLRFTTDMINSGEALEMIQRAFEIRRKENAELCGD